MHDAALKVACEAFATFGQTGHLRAAEPSIECMRAVIAAYETEKRIQLAVDAFRRRNGQVPREPFTIADFPQNGAR